MLSDHFVKHAPGFAASKESLPLCSASVIKAFHNAQPLPRDQVPDRAKSGAKGFATFPREKRPRDYQSQAGSPTPVDPKSMTALKRPLVTSKFPALTFPWIQTGRPRHLVLKACFPD